MKRFDTTTGVPKCIALRAETTISWMNVKNPISAKWNLPQLSTSANALVTAAVLTKATVTYRQFATTQKWNLAALHVGWTTCHNSTRESIAETGWSYGFECHWRLRSVAYKAMQLIYNRGVSTRQWGRQLLRLSY